VCVCVVVVVVWQGIDTEPRHVDLKDRQYRSTSKKLMKTEIKIVLGDKRRNLLKLKPLRSAHSDAHVSTSHLVFSSLGKSYSTPSIKNICYLFCLLVQDP